MIRIPLLVRGGMRFIAPINMKFEELVSSDELATFKEQERIENKELSSGLTHVGHDKSGDDLYIGTRKQWDEADKCGYDEHMSHEENYQQKLIEF